MGSVSLQLPCETDSEVLVEAGTALGECFLVEVAEGVEAMVEAAEEAGPGAAEEAGAEAAEEAGAEADGLESLPPRSTTAGPGKVYEAFVLL